MSRQVSVSVCFFILGTWYSLTCGILTLLITLTNLKMRSARSARNMAKDDVSDPSPELDWSSARRAKGGEAIASTPNQPLT